MILPLNPGYYSKPSCLVNSVTIPSLTPPVDIINLDTVDGKHANLFVWLSNFPILLTNPTTDDILKFNGTNWVNSSVTPGTATLLYFQESQSDTASIWEILDSKSYFLKTTEDQNFQIGVLEATLTGKFNFLSSTNATTLTTITGNNNTSFSDTADIFGDYNVIFNATGSIFGNLNVVINNSNSVGLLPTRSSSYNFIFGGATVTNELLGSYCFSINGANVNYSLEGASGATILNTVGLIVNANYVTAINAVNCEIHANYGFVSGYGLILNSERVVAFGKYGSVEPVSPNSARLFFIGNGSSTNARSNAITIWRSGATQIAGALKIGAATGNVTANPVEGMIKEVGGYLSIYRGGAWQTDLSGYSVLLTDLDTVDLMHASEFVWTTDFPLSAIPATEGDSLKYLSGAWTPVSFSTAIEPAWSVADFGLSPTPVECNLTGGTLNTYTTDYRIVPGSVVLTNKPLFVMSGLGVITVSQSGIYLINVDLDINVSACVTGHTVEISIVKNVLTTPVVLRRFRHVITVLTSLLLFLADIPISTTLTKSLTSGDTIEIFIHYVDSGGNHKATPNSLGTSVSFVEIFGATA